MTSRKQRIEQLRARFVEAQRELHEGSADVAAARFESLAEDWAELDGPDCERALTMRGFRGRALTDARRFTEAEAVLAALLIDRERILGPDDEQTLVARGNLMRAVAFGGRPREAIVLAGRLVEDRSRIYGPDDMSVHRMRAHIARFHFEMEEYATAAEIYGEVLDAFERLGNDDAREMAEMDFNRAVSRLRSDPSDEAVREFEEIIDELETELGPENPWTITAMSLLAGELAFSRDELERARQIYVEVLRRSERVSGPFSQDTLEARRSLARVLIALGRPGEAVANLVEGITMAEAVEEEDEIGALHARMDLVWARMELVGYLSGLGDDEGQAVAEREFRLAQEEFASLEFDSRTLEPDHALRVEILDVGVEYGLDAYEAADDILGDVFTSLGVQDDNERHMVHYRFGFGAIPSLVFADAGMPFLFRVCGDDGPETLAELWSTLCAHEGHECEPEEFVVEERRAANGDILIAIELPEVRASHECYVVGVRVDLTEVGKQPDGPYGVPSLQAPGLVRVLHCESTAFGGTMLGETTIDGSHGNLGLGPAPTIEGMFAVLESLVTDPDPSDGDDAPDVEPTAMRRPSWWRRRLAGMLRGLADAEDRRRARRG